MRRVADSPYVAPGRRLMRKRSAGWARRKAQAIRRDVEDVEWNMSRIIRAEECKAKRRAAACAAGRRRS